MKYLYGMKLRGFSPGCQPMDGLDRGLFTYNDDDLYHDFLVYDRELTEDELFTYDLVLLAKIRPERYERFLIDWGLINERQRKERDKQFLEEELKRFNEKHGVLKGRKKNEVCKS